MRAIKHRTAALGFTLIELLLALALGAFVVAISIALYQYAKSAYMDSGRRLLVTEKLAVSQHLFKEAAMGSIESCSSAATRLSLVDSSQPWLQAGKSAIEIYPAQNNVKGFKKIGTKIGERDDDSDVLLLRAAPLPATPIISHDIANDKFIVGNSIGLTRGGLAIVCDGKVAVVFQVAYTTGRHIHYAGDGIVPGNCTGAFASESCGGRYLFGKGALLAHYAPSVFYIANGYTGSALYRQKPTIFRSSHSRRLSMRSQELVSGVIRLQAASGRADSGHNNGLVLQITIAGDANKNPRHHETYLYTLPL